MPQDSRSLARTNDECAPEAVVLYGQDSSFFDFAGFHLAAIGLKPVAVICADRLKDVLAGGAPTCVLLHWNTLQESSFSICAALKARSGVKVIVVSEQLSGGPSVLKSFASGADGLIEGASNPRILLTRLKSILGQSRPVSRYA